MDWMTPILTVVSAATAVGIVATNQMTPAAPTHDVVAYLNAPVAPAVKKEVTSYATETTDPIDTVFVSAPEAREHELELAAYRWHEILDDARREAAELPAEAPHTRPTTRRLSGQERLTAERVRLARDRQMRAQRRQKATELRARRAVKTVFTRSEFYKRHGSSYRASPRYSNLNRNQRRIRR